MVSICFAVVRELFQEFQQFQLLFWGFFRQFRCDQGSCFGDFSGFSYFFPEFFHLLGWIGVLFQRFYGLQLPKQDLSAINIWLLYTMLIQCGDIMLKNKNDGSYWISAVKLLKNFALKETILKCEVFYIIIQLQPWQISFYHV